MGKPLTDKRKRAAPSDAQKKMMSARISRCNALIARVGSMLAHATDQGRKDRLQARLERAARSKEMYEAKLSELNGTFEHYLAERKFKPYRTLTLQEERVGFVRLDEMLTQQSDQFEREMVDVTTQEIERLTKSMEKKVDAWDIAAIAALAFLIRGEVKAIIRKAIGTFYGIGVGAAVKEINASGDSARAEAKANPTTANKPIPAKVDRGETPAIDKRLMSLDSEDIAEAYVANLENTAKSTIKSGIAVDAATLAITSAMQARLVDEASKTITNISKTITGEYLNRGRSSIFKKNLVVIVAFQRSEVLDGRTCPMCLSLDKRVVKPDDPMASLQIVHTHCRGVWVPIFAVDKKIPEVTGIPKAIVDRFDTIDGRPVVNSFKNMKKPINDVSKAAQAVIKKRF